MSRSRTATRLTLTPSHIHPTKWSHCYRPLSQQCALPFHPGAASPSPASLPQAGGGPLPRLGGQGLRGRGPSHRHQASKHCPHLSRDSSDFS